MHNRRDILSRNGMNVCSKRFLLEVWGHRAPPWKTTQNGKIDAKVAFGEWRFRGKE